jgi:hypothetical protein
MGGSMIMFKLDTPHPEAGLPAGTLNCFFQISVPSSESTA